MQILGPLVQELPELRTQNCLLEESSLLKEMGSVYEPANKPFAKDARLFGKISVFIRIHAAPAFGNIW
jgi:hypothetical protein